MVIFRDFGLLRILFFSRPYLNRPPVGERLYLMFWRDRWATDDREVRGAWEARLFWLELRWRVHRP